MKPETVQKLNAWLEDSAQSCYAHSYSSDSDEAKNLWRARAAAYHEAQMKLRALAEEEKR